MAVSIFSVFVMAAVLALAASSLIAWQLATYKSGNDALSANLADRGKFLFLDGAALQLHRMTDFLSREIQRMRLATNQTNILVIETANTPAIRTSAGALLTMNTSLYAAYAHRVAFDRELYGFAVNFLYPPDTPNVTNVQSIQTYADPLFDGGLQPIQAWTDPMSGITGAFQVLLDAAPDIYAANGAAFRTHVDDSAPLYTFDYFGSSSFAIGYKSRFDMLPWQSSDGNPWWFLQQSTHLIMQGVNVVVQTYASTVAWEAELNLLMQTPGSYYVLYDTDTFVMATSYPPAVADRKACIMSSTGTDLVACISKPLSSNTSAPFFQFLGKSIVPAANAFTALSSAGASYLYTDFNGSRVALISIDSVRLDGPANAALTLLWFQFNPTETGEASTGGSATVTSLIIIIVVVAALSTLGVGVIVYRAFITPIDMMMEQMQAVTELDIEAIDQVVATEAAVATSSSTAAFSEMAALRSAFAKMTASIQWFLLYLPRDVMQDLIDSNATSTSARELEEKRITVIFIDIANFTSETAALAQRRTAFVDLLQHYFEDCSNALSFEGCTIDKFIGDAIMGFWGAPTVCEEQAEKACFAALRLVTVVEKLRPSFGAYGWNLRVRMGINTGIALVGSIGSRSRLNFTALGNTVNMASRLEGLCKVTHSTILVGEAVVDALHQDQQVAPNPSRSVVGDLILRRVGRYILKGSDEAMTIFQLCGSIHSRVFKTAAPATASSPPGGAPAIIESSQVSRSRSDPSESTQHMRSGKSAAPGGRRGRRRRSTTTAMAYECLPALPGPLVTFVQQLHEIQLDFEQGHAADASNRLDALAERFADSAATGDLDVVSTARQLGLECSVVCEAMRGVFLRAHAQHDATDGNTIIRMTSK